MQLAAQQTKVGGALRLHGVQKQVRCLPEGGGVGTGGVAARLQQAVAECRGDCAPSLRVTARLKVCSMACTYLE